MTASGTHGSLDLLETSLEVIRSCQAESGAILASPTFSQYGYSWLRDGAFIAESLDLVGETERASGFHRWVCRIILGSADAMERARASGRRGQLPSAGDYLHCRYTTDGSSVDDDWPTFQLDGPGIWLWSLAHHLRHGGLLDAELERAIDIAARYLGDLWTLPCADAWEEFGEHVHTSTLAAIQVGIEAAVSMVPALADEPAIDRLRRDIGTRLSVVDGAYTKWHGAREVDGSLLWMAAPYQSVAPTEVVFAATLRRIEEELISDGVGVHRYRSDTYYGGGAWPVLTSAYGRVLLRRGHAGDRERAADALR